ncbi:MAG: VOC family protein [Geodermatophilaceae bacterium]
MRSRLAVVALDARDPSRIAEFWAAALDWDSWPDPEEGGVSLAPPGASGPSGAAGPSIDVMPVPEGKTVKNRLHFDLRADGSTQAEEVDRLLGLGATRVDVGQKSDVSWVVLADPEGNEFCVLQRSVQEVDAAAVSGP